MSKHTPKKYFDSNGNLIIKPYRMIDLENIFDVDARTLKKWIKEYQTDIGEKKGKYFTILQVSTIIQKIGLPGIWTIRA